LSRRRGEELILPRPGEHDRVRSPLTAIVAGGGLAGVAAATVLAERGVSVILAEREPFLGGRAAAWTDRLASGESFEMERGFHAFFRQYYNLQSLLRRIDKELSFLDPLEDYPILGPGGQVESFSGLPIKPPWNVIALTKRTPTLGLRDLIRVNGRAALAMLQYESNWTYDRYDQQTAGEYLDSLSFPPDARRMLFDVFAHSFFNPEEAMSAGELLMMFHFYFSGNPEGLIIDVSKRPFSKSIWEPLHNYMGGLGVDVRTACAVARVARGSGRPWSVLLDGEVVEGDFVVLALNVPALQKVVADSPDLNDSGFRNSIEGLALTHPFAVWRMWLDRPGNPDRTAFVGTTGVGSLGWASSSKSPSSSGSCWRPA
jgi:isorenieratene synthase